MCVVRAKSRNEHKMSGERADTYAHVNINEQSRGKMNFVDTIAPNMALVRR